MALLNSAVDLRPDDREERDLVERLRAGDQDAITSFYLEYSPRLVQFACGRIPNDLDQVGELVHAVLLKAINRFDTFRNDAAVFSWLCAICRNDISDHFARIARERRHMLSSDSDPGVRTTFSLLAGPESDEPENRFLRLQRNARIQSTIDRIPMNCGRALELKYLYGFTVAEIADRLDLSLKAAESVLARARVAFRQNY